MHRLSQVGHLRCDSSGNDCRSYLNAHICLRCEREGQGQSINLGLPIPDNLADGPKSYLDALSITSMIGANVDGDGVPREPPRG
jgi:hypothetical protein